MTDQQWVKIKSWHAVRTVVQGGYVQTRCGRSTLTSLTSTSDTLPAERSCETCTRIITWQEERAAQ